MTKVAWVLLVVLSFAATAGAQEFPNEPYEFLLAKLAAQEGDYDAALKHLDKVIAKNPSDPVLLYERAMVYVDAGRVDRAESELRAVLAKNPDFYDANRILGRLLLDRSNSDKTRMEEALKYLEAAYKASPDDLSTGVAVSQIYSQLGRLDDAERILATLVERAPDQRSLNYTYAQVLTKLGRGDESKKYLERAVTIDPTFGAAIMQLLDMYQQENEWQKAADVLQPLIAEDPMNLEMQRQQAYFYLSAGDARAARDRFKALVAADAKDQRSRFYLGESLNDLEEYAESEKLFRDLSAAEPNDPDYIASLGISLAGQKKWEDAATTFNHLLRLPNVPDHLTAMANTQLAYIDLQRGNHAAAVEMAKAVLSFRDKPNAQAINIAVEALKKDKKYAEAVALLQPLVTKFESDPFVNAKYVEALVRAGQKPKALAHAQAQVKVGTRNTNAAAEALVAAESTPDAIALVKSAVAAHPDDVDLQFELGSVYERAGDRKTAEQVFQQILEKTPDHAPSLNYLGYMWAEGGENLEKAQEMLTRAVGQDPNNGAYIDSLGWVYYRLGKLELAEKYLTDATKLLPRDATVHEHLGDVLAKRGDAPRALQLYRTALDLDPESKEVTKLRSKIAEIERKGTSAQR
ncbi:MAG TPA: tetratricopeptide repeat protein [Thermoanaerobaculia bacterium]|nr:tetratricopeptide repeat protein [Thermoanaerobaculia bacterium]